MRYHPPASYERHVHPANEPTYWLVKRLVRSAVRGRVAGNGQWPDPSLDPSQSFSAPKAIRIDPLQQLRGVHRRDEGVVVADGHVNVAATPVRIHG
jgi:hypothetical protein